MKMVWDLLVVDGYGLVVLKLLFDLLIFYWNVGLQNFFRLVITNGSIWLFIDLRLHLRSIVFI